MWYIEVILPGCSALNTDEMLCATSLSMSELCAARLASVKNKLGVYFKKSAVLCLKHAAARLVEEKKTKKKQERPPSVSASSQQWNQTVTIHL